MPLKKDRRLYDNRKIDRVLYDIAVSLENCSNCLKVEYRNVTFTKFEVSLNGRNLDYELEAGGKKIEGTGTPVQFLKILQVALEK